MTEDEKRRYISYISLSGELQNAASHGMRLYLSGIPSSAGDIAKACVFSEDCAYLRDYVVENGRQPGKIEFGRQA